MKIAILGGSFNPPHIGHTFVCCYVLSTTDVEQMWMVPCYQHAFGKPLEAFQHRFTMCRLALTTLRDSRVHVSSIEQERQGTSWTIDTVRYLRKCYPEHEFVWVIGSDVLSELDNWKGAEELRRMISFLVVPRGGFLPPEKASRTPDERYREQFQQPPASHSGSVKLCAEFKETPEFQLPDISSSEIRQRIRTGHSIAHLVSREVVEYIDRHHLYVSRQ